MVCGSVVEVYSFERAAMQDAVAEGPNHWPGCLLQEAAPWETKRWMLKGAVGWSAKRERIWDWVVETEDSGGRWEVLRRQERPAWRRRSEFARRDWPERIMQPQPVSLVKPSFSVRLRRRTVKVMLVETEGSCERGIGGKLFLYVIHIRDSKSSMKARGQPPSFGSLDREGRF